MNEKVEEDSKKLENFLPLEVNEKSKRKRRTKKKLLYNDNNTLTIIKW